MVTLFNTLALTQVGSVTPWDLALDGNGNMAMLAGANALAQDVASAISTFYGEVWYDSTVGVPYLAQVFAQNYSPSIVAQLLKNQALQVPNVDSAQVVINSFINRILNGTVNFIDVNGAANGVTFGSNS